MKKRLLITGGSHAELPLIEEAKAAGWYVISTGNNTEGLGHKAADEYRPGDFSDKEFILSLARELQVDAMISGCNDFAYISTAYACDRLGLPGHDSYETASIVHHKDAFKNVTRKLGIRTPGVVRCMSEDDVVEAGQKLGYPIVIKPVDLTGGKGVQICQDQQSALDYYREAKAVTREPYVIAEECIKGSNHGASVLLKNQQVVFSVFDDEQYYLNKYLVAGASMPPANMTNETKQQLVTDIEKAATALKLVDGLFHVQFMVEADGTAVMIDPCRRAPGDLYILLAKYHTGVNYPAEIVKAETGMPLFDDYQQQYNYVARECIMTDHTGIIQSIDISQEVHEHLVHSMIWGKAGDEITDIMKYKAGILISQHASAKELADVLARYHELVKINCCLSE